MAVDEQDCPRRKQMSATSPSARPSPPSDFGTRIPSSRSPSSAAAALPCNVQRSTDLAAAAAGRHAVQLSVSSLPEVTRGPDARARIGRGYWTIEPLLGAEPAALIVTVTGPIAARMGDEPCWG